MAPAHMRSIAKPGNGLGESREDRDAAAERESLVAGLRGRGDRDVVDPVRRNAGVALHESDRRLDGEIVRSGVPVHALLAGAPEGCAHAVDEEDVRSLGHSASKNRGMPPAYGRAVPATGTGWRKPTKPASDASRRLLHGIHKGIGDHAVQFAQSASAGHPALRARRRRMPRSTASGETTRRGAAARASAGSRSASTAPRRAASTSGRAAFSRASASGLRSAHARGGGSESPPVARSSGSSSLAAPGLDRRPPAVELRSARPAGELLHRGELLLRLRVGEHRRDERAVGHEPAGRDILLAGVVLARGPQLACHGERLAAAHGVEAAQPPPGLSARRAWARAPARPGTPRRRTRSCPAPTSSAASASRTSTRCSTSSAAYSSHDCGSGRVDQSDAECAFASVMPERVLDDRAESDPLVAEEARGQLGVEDRARARGRARAATADPGSQRGAPTPRRRSRPGARGSRRSAGDRRGRRPHRGGTPGSRYARCE